MLYSIANTLPLVFDHKMRLVPSVWKLRFIATGPVSWHVLSLHFPSARMVAGDEMVARVHGRRSLFHRSSTLQPKFWRMLESLVGSSSDGESLAAYDLHSGALNCPRLVLHMRFQRLR